MEARRKKRPFLTFQCITSPRVRRLRRKRRVARKKRKHSSEDSSSSREESYSIKRKERKKIQSKINRHQKWLDSLHKKKSSKDTYQYKIRFYVKCAGAVTFGFMIGVFINAVVLLT